MEYLGLFSLSNFYSYLVENNFQNENENENVNIVSLEKLLNNFEEILKRKVIQKFLVLAS